MQIPLDDQGRPVVSTNQFRTYGTGGFTLDEHEKDRGCPRQYHAKYVEKRIPEQRSYALDFGSFFHDVMYRMEEEGLSPDDALQACMPITATPEMYSEARADLQAYLEREASPRDRLATVAVELDFSVPLYDDEDHGQVMFRAIIDRVALDPDVPGVVYVEDYKTNRYPPSNAQVRGDVQLKGYAWAVREYAEQIGLPPNPRVVVILNAVKWREVEVTYTDQVIEDWHSWAVAVTRTILRDEEAKPVINPGCDWCPVRDDCPAFQALPDVGSRLLVALGGIDEEDAETRLRWRDRANEVRLRLEKAVTKIDDQFKEQARKDGVLAVGTTLFKVEPDWRNEWDIRALHDVLGDTFYDVVTVTKKAVDTVSATLPPSTLAAVQDTLQRVPLGTRVVKKEIEDGGEDA